MAEGVDRGKWGSGPAWKSAVYAAATFATLVVLMGLLGLILSNSTDTFSAVGWAIVLGTGCFAIGVAAYINGVKEAERRSHYARRETEARNTTWLFVVCRLDERIEALGRRSGAIYFTILAVLIAGVALVIFAGHLASLDSRARTLDQSLMDRERATLAMARDLARQEAADAVAASKLGRGPVQMAASSDAGDLEKGAFQTFQDVEQDRKALFQATLREMAANSGVGGEINVGGMVLRACVIGLLIFLVQILVQLYRYNSRLIAFYGARRDALMISEGDVGKLKALVPILAPSGLDFGRQPTHPLQEISGLVSTALTRKRPAAGAAKPAAGDDA